ncbi:hypothetical protein Aab01nite_63660 [Paractinoplanes abujensis]|uniref:Uncharacterized protein n=1 Tax=Paractinoplanes abujensis TaxID=882441 RepID=A0A7W7G1K1_9ACTN|nr:hypothetical protein [Actinoplanes abujensis]MBB4692724.1 hypothetical protein [Actinoplanes abujensis]GID22776.1 hypothetical protein Aab01nite_63660 [Actinoplanes abujensis]
MVAFEDRYGGLSYSVTGGNPMEYGLEGDNSVLDTPYGPAFPGIVDGSWTWGLDVLADGRTIMGPGRLPYRVIDRSLEQRLERPAMLFEVHTWFHQVFECFTPSDVGPIADEAGLPPPVPQASGPAEVWWRGPDVAVQAVLAGWPPGRDRWVVRYFARRPWQVFDAAPTIYAAMCHETVPASWCGLCGEPIAAGSPCVRR